MILLTFGRNWYPWEFKTMLEEVFVCTIHMVFNKIDLQMTDNKGNLRDPSLLKKKPVINDVKSLDFHLS